jgi:hypothetical protein
MHITTGSGNAQGFPTAGDWMMRIQYAPSDPAYDVTKEQWEIVRATLRPATAHGTDYDTIDITRVVEGADAPTDWPVGSVVYNVVSKEHWDELWTAIDLKMATADDAAAAVAAMDAHYAAAGGVQVGTGAGTAAEKNLLSINAHGAATGFDDPAGTITLDFSANAKHSVTVDEDITIVGTDPGINDELHIYFTKSADANARAITWFATIYWNGSAPLSSLPSSPSGGRYAVHLSRISANVYWGEYAGPYS